MAVALAALVLRVNLSAEHQTAWTAQVWFTLALAALSLAMLRAYPLRVCVHLSLAFLTWSVVAVARPIVDLGVLRSAWPDRRWRSGFCSSSDSSGPARRGSVLGSV